VARLPERRRLQGTIQPGGPDWLYLPVEVPAGVGELAVRYRYDRPPTPPGVPGNALDLGVLDERAGFRGWSGGARDGFTISGSGATPGYLPGPIGQGTWQVVLGPYTVDPGGLAWEVEVTLGEGPPGPAFVPDPAPERAAGRGRGWYRGDLHTHTVHSDGRRTPAELAAAARAAGLDFIASTEHNTTSANLGWGAHAGTDLLVIGGQEVTTRDGHWLAIGLGPGPPVDWRYRAADGALGPVLAGLRERGGLAVAAHPFCPLPGCGWGFGYQGLDAVEVWNGPWTPDDEAALGTWDRLLAAGAGGGFLPAVAGSDAHGQDDRVGLPQNVVLADGLDRRSILDGLAAGRCWLAESGRVDLTFEVRGGGGTAGTGGRLRARPDERVTARLEVLGTPGHLVRVFTDTGQVLEAALPGGGPGRVEWTTTARRSAYVRAEVRRPEPTPDTPGTMVALTNPVFLGPARQGP
jgi:hypothetical protein